MVDKLENLEHILKRLDSILVAFSGGVDSTLLLAVSHRILGDKTLAVTSVSAIHSEREMRDAERYPARMGIRHRIMESSELEIPEFVENRRDRCYLCKKNLFRQLSDIAKEEGIAHVAHGANMDDLEDYRPGFKAAKEAGAIAPLIEAEMTKAEIRQFSKKMGLSSWDKPAMACLASRIPYGMSITSDRLTMDSKAEDVIFKLGFRSCRVRHHGKIARIEIDPGDFEKVMTDSIRVHIVEKLKEIGYSHIALDLEGYVQGSLNR